VRADSLKLSREAPSLPGEEADEIPQTNQLFVCVRVFVPDFVCV